MNATASTHGILVSLLRASALTLAFTCPGSIRETDIQINSSNSQARTGSAAHEVAEDLPDVACREVVTGLYSPGGIDFDEIDNVAIRCGVDANDLRYLSRQAAKLWGKVKDSFPGAITEVAVAHTLQISGLRVTGRIDLISIQGDVARLADWKFGRLDSDYYHQMMAYASMVLLEYPSIREVTATILWARDQEVENYTVTRAEAEKWAERLEREVVQWDGVFHPSEKCKYCPRSYNCQAFNALARSYAAVLMDVDVDRIESQLATMPGQQVIELRRKADMLEKIAKSTKEAIRNVLLHKGEIRGDGATLTINSRPRGELEPLPTIAVLEQSGLDETEWSACVSVSKTAVERAIAARAPRGSKEEAKKKLLERLEQAGALHYESTLVVTERRI